MKTWSGSQTHGTLWKTGPGGSAAPGSQREPAPQPGVPGSSGLVGPLREWRFRFSPLAGLRSQQRSVEHVELEQTGRIGLQAQEAMRQTLESGRASRKKQSGCDEDCCVALGSFLNLSEKDGLFRASGSRLCPHLDSGLRGSTAAVIAAAAAGN